jgi:uncharacterized RDD family membrane protein YckC
MLVGVILYLKSKGKEIRLLRFAFAIILIVKARSIFGFFLSMLLNGNIFQQESYYIFLSILFFISSLVWVWASYSVIKLLSKNISLLKVVKKKDHSEDYVDSPKSQRFLHHILDLILSITIFSKFVMFFLEPLLMQIENSVGERTALYFIILISRLIYFVVFEFGFRATPAKLLTGSQIIVNSGKSLSLKTVILRSLYRHVPFDALSYLGEGNGWHDQWANTRVVKEENLNRRNQF